MNVLTWTLALTVVGLSSTSVYLYSELDAARNQAAAQTPACHDQQTQIEALHQECVALEPDAMPGERRSTRNVAGDNSDPGEAVFLDEFDRRTSVSDPGVRECAVTGSGREIPRARYEAALRRMYNGLARELNLSPEQEVQLLDLLLEQRIEQFEAVQKFAGDRAAMSSATNELKQGNDTELMTVLGDKYLQFEDYQKGLGERMQIDQAALQLEAASVPLREAQRNNLLAVMVGERDRIPRPAWIAGASAQENTAQQRAWQEDYEERVRDRASSVLTSDQLKQYDVYRNLQSTMRRRQLETWREAIRPPLAPVGQAPGPT